MLVHRGRLRRRCALTAIAVGERGDDTALAACTSILYRVCYDPPQSPMNTPVREGETIEGSRTMRNRPYQVLKQVLKCTNNKQFLYIGNRTISRWLCPSFIQSPPVGPKPNV